MYLAIEGVIGVGKTSLARLLQPAFDAALILEAFEENPFLSDFYGDRKRYAFQTQIFFLLSRYRQQRETVPEALAQGNLIADYTFEKDALFADLNLDGDELSTYSLVHSALAERIPDPDLIVYLRANTDTAMQRIAMRDRTYERNMSRDYIEALNRVYEARWGDPSRGGILAVDSDNLDFVANRDHLKLITDRIRAALGIPPYQREFPFASDPPITGPADATSEAG
ncbi:MAG: deoxynucleoside kinase [Anaerolineales bacterium]|jgi:deoxyguanosine kinase